MLLFDNFNAISDTEINIAMSDTEYKYGNAVGKEMFICL